MSLGWGYIPMQPAAAAAGTAIEENIEVIQLITNRASMPSLGDFLAELHNSEVLSDITICSEDGQAIKCHKLVLIRWSAPFRRMLCGDMREAREKSITLHGVDGEVLAAFIRFLYTCNCSIAPEKLVGLCAMADQYDVTLLQQLCMDAIRTHANNHRCCCLFYKAAKDIQQPEIQQLAWEQLSSNLHSLVQQHDVFVQLEFEDVLRLFSRPEAQAGTDGSAAGTSAAAAAAVGSSSAVAAAAVEGRPFAGAATAAAAVEHAPAENLLQAAAERLRQGAQAAAARGQAGAADGAAAVAAVQREMRRELAQEALELMALGGAEQHELDEADRQMIELLGVVDAHQQQQHQQQPMEQWWHVPLQQPRQEQQQQQQQQHQAEHGLSRQEIAAAYQETGRPPSVRQPSRPEYALFLASMAWLHHLPERQQYKQQLYECFDFNAMRDNELSQMRRNPHVQSDPDLKEMLLDAFERRCLDHAQQPVYHMAPMPRSSGWGHPAW